MMGSASVTPPVSGLGDLNNESRLIATPWSRMVRGIGLGQYAVDFDPRAAAHIRAGFDMIAVKVSDSNAYHRFCRLMADFALAVSDPRVRLDRDDVERRLGVLLEAVRAVPNPYWRLMAGCVLLDGFAKLGLDRTPLLTGRRDVPTEVLATADEIEPNGIEDENQGNHGDYERLSAYSAVLLAYGRLGLQDRLVSGPRDYIREALGLLDRIPAPFFRGRGGSMLFSAISLLGYDAIALDGERDHLRDVLEYLDRVDELRLPPAFPQPMTEAFGKVYPLLTMLNAVAATGRAEYLTHGRDRLAQARELVDALAPAERTHMGLYYIVALHNLGRLHEQLPSLDGFVEGIVGQWRGLDPGDNYFLNGIAYPYMIQTAMMTGRMDLVSEEMLNRVVDSYPDYERHHEDRVNRPYPFAYLVNILGELGAADRLFEGRARYDGDSPFSWVAAHLSPDAEEEGSRLHMLGHALVSYALRQRGRNAAPGEVFANFKFPLALS